jgi:hypothetical protein
MQSSLLEQKTQTGLNLCGKMDAKLNKELVPFGRIAYHRECLYEGQYIKII